MGILRNLLGGVSARLESDKRVKELESKLKASDKTKEDISKALENLQRDIRRERNEAEYQEIRARRHHDDELNDRDTDQEIALARVEDEANARVEEAEKKARSAESEADLRVKLARTEAKTEVREEYSSTIHSLESDLATERADTAAAEARAKEKDSTIESLREQISDYKEFVQFVLGKVPTVDLSKFSINIDMPPTEVTVVGGNKPEQKGGGEQKKQ